MIDVVLSQFNNEFNFDKTSFYLPYSAGLLSTYAKKHYSGEEQLHFNSLMFRRSGLESTAEKISVNDVAGFSTYSWNWNFSIEVARLAKLKNKNLFVVFGGPQVPMNSEKF